MRALSPAGKQIIEDVANRHGFSADATVAMLEAVIKGNGRMAQFDHPEFGGSGQWMRGGMIMISKMFDGALQHRISSLCDELATLAAGEPDLLRQGSFQSQSQGSRSSQSQDAQIHSAPTPEQGAFAEAATSAAGVTSGLFTRSAHHESWWPAELRSPSSTGAQNGMRYAYFPDASRLAIARDGEVTVYDIGKHRIGGFSQQQHSSSGDFTFASQHGRVDVATLPVVWSSDSKRSESQRAHAASAAVCAPAPEASAPSRHATLRAASHSPPSNNSSPSAAAPGDVFAHIERLADLHDKGVLTEAEFVAKKSELLARI